MNAAVFDMLNAEDPAGAGEASSETGKQHTWNADTLSAVAKFGQTVDEVKATREAANAKLAAAKTSLVEMGFNGDARKSLGVPIQEDLFTAAMQDEVTVDGD